MAAFDTIPGLIITSETSIIPDDGRSIRHAEGGQIRGRNAYFETVYRISVIVKGNLTVKQALDAFYLANTNVLNVINIDGTNYSSMFSDRPAVTSKDGDIRWLSFGLIGFDADSPTPVSGVAGVGAVGSVVISIPKTVIVSGVTGTGVVGTVTIDAQADVIVAGVAGVGAVGSVIVDVSQFAPVSGIAGASAVGSVVVDAQAVVTVIGIAATGAVGAATVNAQAVVSPSGLAGTGAVGTVTVTTS